MLGKWKKIKKIAVVSFLLATITFGMIGDTTTVFAQAPEEDDFDAQFNAGNDVFFWDPTYQNVCSADGGALVGGSTKEKIWNFLIANDLSAEQAAGLMANMDQESSFIPVRYQGDRDFNPWTPNKDGEGKGWGLVQWDGGRRLDVINTIKEEKSHLKKYIEYEYNGIAEPNDKFPAKDFDEFLLFELDYMMQESISRNITAAGFPGSADKEWPRMKEQPTVRDATLFWERNFEVSGDDQAQKEERVVNAQAIFNEFEKNLSAAGSGTAGCAAADSLQELTLAYAWPDYEAGKTAKKPAYEEAVVKAKDEGRYVGDLCFGGGVDCGGFTTLLITNSGHDPKFNHGGVGADGAGNTVTQKAWASKNWSPVRKAGTEFSTSDLRPGDVAFIPGHTFVFVGDVNGDEPGFETQIASASQCDHAPMEGTENPDAANVEWYRKKGA